MLAHFHYQILFISLLLYIGYTSQVHRN